MKSKENKKPYEKMFDLAFSLPPSSDRAQAYNIGHKLKYLSTSNTIAQMMIDDHRVLDAARRHCHLLISAGLCIEKYQEKNYWGELHFIDGSVILKNGEVA